MRLGRPPAQRMSAVVEKSVCTSSLWQARCGTAHASVGPRACRGRLNQVRHAHGERYRFEFGF